MRYLITAVLLAHMGVPIGSPARADSQDPDVRAASTESRMTDVERFGLLHGIMALPPASPRNLPIPEGVKFTAGYIKGVNRLGIPDILESDASLGVVNPLQLRPGDTSTAMPSGLALASSFDPDLAFRSGATIGAEARAKGFNVLLGGGVNLARDPRNGRNFEYLGEDPLLAGTMAGESIRGTQTQGVVSTVKHFALNDQETQRHSLDARIVESALRESDLLAFEIAIEQGRPGAVMCAYNKLNGDQACGDDYLLNRVLKHDWGYKGWVMSDWGAVHDVSYFSKGLDQQSGAQLDAKVWFDGPLKAEVAAGRVPKKRVSDAVQRILRSLYAVGADRVAPYASIDYAAHAEVARQVAAQGIVLLKNEGILPLSADVKSILVIGGHADIGVLSGGGSSQVTPYGGASIVIPVGGPGTMAMFAKALYMPSSPLKALRSALPNATIDFQSGYDVGSAAAGAARSDVAIVFATQWQTEGYDHASMELPEGQEALIVAVTKANPNTIVVLETGNPVKMPWLSSVKAVLEAWYPGEEGGTAVADVLSGVVNPSGHLPISFPIDESQLPRSTISGFDLPEGSPVTADYAEGAAVGYRWYIAQHKKPMFPFGFGLSYTHFEFSKLRLDRSDGPDPKIAASFTVKNTGRRSGAAAPQLYLIAAAGTELCRLIGFSRVALEPQESRSVHVLLDPRFFGHWNSEKNRWQIDRGRYEVALGSSATELGEQAELALPARTIAPARAKGEIPPQK
jgi:beta-glucosidase